MSVSLKPFFCYYGGKWRAAPRYPAPLYDTVIEPFAGAAGYSTRHFERRVILLEKDPVVAALWKYLIRVSASEIRALPLVANDQTVDDVQACPEGRSLIGFWLNPGSAQPKLKASSRFKLYLAEHPGSFWSARTRDRIASQVEQIRHWRVVEGSYEQIPNPSKAATWYVDPPYQRQGTYYRCSAKAIDFRHLADWCRRLSGQVMVCEQAGADWLPFQPFARIRAGLKKHCNEVLWESAGAQGAVRV